MNRFRKNMALFGLAWIASLVGVIYFVLFHSVMEDPPIQLSKKPKLPQSVFQEREGISKDLWITSRNERTHCHLEAPSSELRLEEKSGLFESLDQLKIWINESNQDIRYLRAKKGDYNYSKQTLTSKEAFLSSYKMTDPNAMIFSCLAKDLTISFHSSPLAFTASGFSAHLQTGNSL